MGTEVYLVSVRTGPDTAVPQWEVVAVYADIQDAEEAVRLIDNVSKATGLSLPSRIVEAEGTRLEVCEKRLAGKPNSRATSIG